MKKSGILASVSLAQFILESGYGKSGLAQNANNLFGMKCSISDLNIRSGPGTNFNRVRFIEPGVYTIVEVRSGKGSSAGWGKLKSGIGWVSLDFVRRI